MGSSVLSNELRIYEGLTTDYFFELVVLGCFFEVKLESFAGCVAKSH